jgi:thiol-disulfide isomerase/thioredoxin
MVAVAALALAAVVPAAADARGVREGDAAPELDGAKDATGKDFQLKANRGSWVVLTFGASWCKPCKKELVAWDKVAAKWAGKVQFVAINLDNDPADGRKFMDRLKIKNMVRVYAPETAAKAADIYVPPTQPTTYVIDPKGVVQGIHEGFVGGDEIKLERQLTRLVKSPS